jgi:hypothetical protein
MNGQRGGKLFGAFLLILAAFLFLLKWFENSKPAVELAPVEVALDPKQNISMRKVEVGKQTKSLADAAKPARLLETVQPILKEIPKVAAQRLESRLKGENPVLRYRLEQGLMVVQGDMVAGVPSEAGTPETGWVEMSPVESWQGEVIPYHIQPGVPSPERIHQAIALFEGTVVRLVPYNGEKDALVFEVGEKNCLSYVGRIGGKQPIWISPGCGAEEVAHEIMHALGFIHEQNRTDRDESLLVHFDNIDDTYRSNFEKLPESFMRLSGLGRFDFQSLMIYPAWMFAKSGKSTMEPRLRENLINPGRSLSPGDVERINKAFLVNASGG